MADNKAWIFLGIGALALLLLFTGHLKLGGTINIQAVLQPGQVSFRTNATTGSLDGSQYKSAGKVIATDINADGALECGVYSTWSSGTSSTCAAAGLTMVTLTPEGFQVCPSASGTSMFIYYLSGSMGQKVTFTKVTTCPAEFLSTSPTAPYTTNNQEVIVGGCTPAWSCTAWSSCPSGTQTRTCTDANNCGTVTNKPAESQSCSVLTYVCDADSDGLISRTELGNVISKWAGG
jgi:hypothetical protein